MIGDNRSGRRRTIALASCTATVVTAAFVLGACSSPPAAAPTTTTTLAKRPSTVATTEGLPTTTAATATTAVGAHACSPSTLAVTYGGQESGVGHFGAVVDVENTGSSPCTLGGYPVVEALDSAGAPVARGTSTSCGYLYQHCGTAPTVFVLQHGEHAWTLIEDSALSSATTCPVYPALQVRITGSSGSPVVIALPTDSWRVMATVGMPGCQALLVHPLLPGTAGEG
jgi:hypothetical protein